MKKQELKKIIRDLRAALAQQQETRTVSQWLVVHERFIREQSYAVSTVSNRVSVLKHIDRIWGHVALGALKPMDVAAGLQEFMPDRSSTAQRVLCEFRDALSSAVANGWGSTNPAQHVKMPKHTVIRKRLTFELWQQMWEHAGTLSIPWVRPMLALALVTGQRRGDLASMKFSDVREGHLHIVQQKKAGKVYGAHVAIPVQLYLEAIGLSLQDVITMCEGYAQPGEYLLRKSNGTPLEHSSLSIRFSECVHAVCKAGAYARREYPSLHEARSLSARLYAKQGVNVQTLLGHAHAEMTDVYMDDRGLSARTFKYVQIPERSTQ